MSTNATPATPPGSPPGTPTTGEPALRGIPQNPPILERQVAECGAKSVRMFNEIDLNTIEPTTLVGKRQKINRIHFKQLCNFKINNVYLPFGVAAFDGLQGLKPLYGINTSFFANHFFIPWYKELQAQCKKYVTSGTHLMNAVKYNSEFEKYSMYMQFPKNAQIFIQDADGSFREGLISEVKSQVLTDLIVDNARIEIFKDKKTSRNRAVLKIIIGAVTVYHPDLQKLDEEGNPIKKEFTLKRKRLYTLGDIGIDTNIKWGKRIK